MKKTRSEVRPLNPLIRVSGFPDSIVAASGRMEVEGLCV